ncbi:hypothetical protein D3C71_1577190 [compost metagenome]
MRRYDNLLHSPQRMIAWQRLILKHIKAGSAELAFVQGIDQSFRIGSPAAPDVDIAGAFFKGREDGGIEQMVGVVGQRQRIDHIIASAYRFLELCGLEHLVKAGHRFSSAAHADSSHVKRLGDAGGFASDFACADDDDCLARQLGRIHVLSSNP